MSHELHGDVAGHPPGALELVLGGHPRDDGRPNVSGDLPTVFRTGPMFRRAVAGYDRYQVDTYVRWAEDELATADRQHENLVARHVRTQAALDEARQLLSRSPGGGSMLRISQRIGGMLAAAADDAASIRAEAEACRAAASARGESVLARAEHVLAAAEAQARRIVADATSAAAESTIRAGRVVDEAQRIRRDARSEAEARLEEVAAHELRAADDAARTGQRAVAEATAARLAARDEIVRMLGTAREERRRADVEAAAIRDVLDRDAATRVAAAITEVKALRRRRSSLRSEIRAMERRRSALQAEVEQLERSVARGPRIAGDVGLRSLLDVIRWRSRSLRSP